MPQKAIEQEKSHDLTELDHARAFLKRFAKNSEGANLTVPNLTDSPEDLLLMTLASMRNTPPHVYESVVQGLNQMMAAPNVKARERGQINKLIDSLMGLAEMLYPDQVDFH